MFKIDRDHFFAEYRKEFGKLTQSQVDGLNRLLDNFEKDDKIVDPRWASYMLATIKRECANTWQPIEEYGKGKGYRYGKPDPETGKVFFGRGFVQLTWKDNYKTMGLIFKVDLVNHPEKALEPDLAYKIMSYGMRNGSFTGVGLKRYIWGEKCEYVQARKIINGLDCAEMIARWAEKFERMLKPAE